MGSGANNWLYALTTYNNALIAGGRLGLKFATLYGTYKRWPKNKKLEALLLEKFSRVEFEKDLMGGAIIVGAYK